MIETIYSHFIQAGNKFCTDSRNIVPGSVFFALKGDSFDGNKFAADAIKKGASLAVIDNKVFQDKNTILVEDSLKALQQLATLYRQRSNFKVLALTGTNGKTTTKELIRLVLSRKYKCCATKGNLNNHIGVPLTILSTPPDTDILIVEMGANHQGEIAELCSIANPDYGLITNIGKAHLEGFGGFQGVIKAKSELYQYLIENKKRIFINNSDKTLLNIIGNYPLVEYYCGENSNCKIDKIEFDGQLRAHLIINSQKQSVKTQLFGKYNVINLLAAVKVGLYFGINVNDILEALTSYSPENNRSQVLRTKQNTLILDSYNANPSSMEAALESFRDISSDNKITILGEMKELGESSIEEHKKLIDIARQIKCKRNLYVGEGFSPFAKQLSCYFENTASLIEFLKREKLSGNLIFIKGSRTNQLEKVVEWL